MPGGNVIHLDTNFVADALTPGTVPEAKLAAWLKAGETFGMSAVAWGEFLCGPVNGASVIVARTWVSAVDSLTEADARLAAKLFNATGRRSRTFADCMIAACAIRNGVKLATSNTADFLPFVPHGLGLA